MASASDFEKRAEARSVKGESEAAKMPEVRIRRVASQVIPETQWGFDEL